MYPTSRIYPILFKEGSLIGSGCISLVGYGPSLLAKELGGTNSHTNCAHKSGVHKSSVVYLQSVSRWRLRVGTEVKHQPQVG